MYAMVSGRFTSQLTIVFVLMGLLLGVVPSRASTMQVMPFEKMCGSAEIIVRGTVATRNAAYDENGLIWTTYDIRTSETLKYPTGKAVATFQIKQLGGTVGDRTLHAAMIPHFEPGERVILFTRDYGGGFQTAMNGPQGALRIGQVDPDDMSTTATARLEDLGRFYPGRPANDPANFLQQVRDQLRRTGDAHRVPSAGEEGPDDANE